MQAELRKDLFPGGKQVFYDMAGSYWTQQMDRFKVPGEMRHNVPMLAADLDSAPYVPGLSFLVMLANVAVTFIVLGLIWRRDEESVVGIPIILVGAIGSGG